MKNTETVYKAYDLERGWNRPKSFRSWCEDNGRRYGHVPSFEEFETNAKAYEAYRELWFSEQAHAHSTAYHAHPSNPSSCEAYQEHYGRRCSCS